MFGNLPPPIIPTSNPVSASNDSNANGRSTLVKLPVPNSADLESSKKTLTSKEENIPSQAKLPHPTFQESISKTVKSR
jgi:hypothetical protein